MDMHTQTDYVTLSGEALVYGCPEAALFLPNAGTSTHYPDNACRFSGSPTVARLLLPLLADLHCVLMHVRGIALFSAKQ